MLPPYEEPIETPGSEPARDDPPSRHSARRVVVGVVVAALVLGAGIGVGAATRSSSTTSTSKSSSTTETTPPTPAAGSAPGTLNAETVAARVDPAVVDIDTTLANGQGSAEGTGMVISANGQVLTNNHVIDEASSISVRSVATGNSYSATVLGYDVTDDIALLQVKGAPALATITPQRVGPQLIGTPVVAIGNALGKGGTPTVVAGVISATSQTVTASENGQNSETLHGMIQTNAQIQPGDSGGPLADAAAQVIGMTTAATTTGNGLQQTTSPNAGFAIPINTALTIARQIAAGQATGNIHLGTRALLGVEVRDTTTGGTSGAQVVGVASGSPAATIGLTAGDTITSVNGTPISNFSDLTNAIAQLHPGDTATIGWTDGSGHQHSAQVKLAAGPPA